MANIHWIIEKARELKLTKIYFCFIDAKAFDCGKFFKRWDHQATLSVSWETCMWVKKQQLESDMEQQTGSKLEKEYVKDAYCHPAYLTSMQSTSGLGWAGLEEAQAGIKIAGRNINNLR